jgi:hypothetical protein
MKKWTVTEKDLLEKNYVDKTDQEIAAIMDRTVFSVRKARQRLGINKNSIDAFRFTDTPKKYKGISGVFGFAAPSGKTVVISSYDVFRSYKQSLSLLKRGKYPNIELCKDYTSDFVFVFFEECTEEALIQRRDFYVRSLDTYNKNLVSGYPEITKDDIDLIKKNTHVNGECLEYAGNMSKGEYGKVSIGGKEYATHRLMYFYEYGTYPTLLRHTCHNTKCCNPNHLIPGSHRENSLDSVEEDRGEFEKAFIKHGGVSKHIAKEFSITEDTVSHKIKELGLRTKHNIPMRAPTKKIVERNMETAVKIPQYFGLYTDEDIAEICSCSLTLVRKTRREYKKKPFSGDVCKGKPNGPFLSEHIKYYVCDGVFGSCYDIVAEKLGADQRHKHGFEEKSVAFLKSLGYVCVSH